MHYLLLQSALVIAWWAWLWQSPAARRLFVPPRADDSHLLSLAPADIAMVGGGSAVTAALVAVASPLARPALWVIAGAVVYATLLAVGNAAVAGAPWLGARMMLPAAAFSALLAATYRAGEPLLPRMGFRPLPKGGRFDPLAHTALQTAAFWVFFLLVMPLYIKSIERDLGVAPLAPAEVRHAGAAIFFVASALGLWSGYTMARLGAGTPLPTSCASRLVVAGPYRFVRNPMAIAGLAQGLGVALTLRSSMMIAFVVVGGIWWERCVRPAEESDLDFRFGDDYRAYRSRVRVWVPGARNGARASMRRPEPEDASAG